MGENVYGPNGVGEWTWRGELSYSLPDSAYLEYAAPEAAEDSPAAKWWETFLEARGDLYRHTPEIARAFITFLRDEIGATLSGGIYGEGEAGQGWNTYNEESGLAGVVQYWQWEVASFPEEWPRRIRGVVTERDRGGYSPVTYWPENFDPEGCDPAEEGETWEWIDTPSVPLDVGGWAESYALVEVHLGGDVRGNYATPYISDSAEAYALAQAARDADAGVTVDAPYAGDALPGIPTPYPLEYRWGTYDAGYRWNDDGEGDGGDLTRHPVYVIDRDAIPETEEGGSVETPCLFHYPEGDHGGRFYYSPDGVHRYPLHVAVYAGEDGSGYFPIGDPFPEGDPTRGPFLKG